MSGHASFVLPVHRGRTAFADLDIARWILQRQPHACLELVREPRSGNERDATPAEVAPEFAPWPATVEPDELARLAARFVTGDLEEDPVSGEALRIRSDAIVVRRAAPIQGWRFDGLGTEARRALKRLARPVLVLPQDWRPVAPGHVVLATCRTPTSSGAACWARRWAAGAGCELHVAHVPTTGGVTGEISPHLMAGFDPIAASLDAWCVDHELGDAPQHILAGDVRVALLNLVERLGPAILVVGATRAPAWERFLFGRGAKLAARAPTPVAVVPYDYGPGAASVPATGHAR